MVKAPRVNSKAIASASEGIWEGIGSLFKRLPERISTMTTGIPTLIQKAGTGAIAAGLVGAGIGFGTYAAGKGIKSALENVGIKDKSASDLVKENVSAYKTAYETAKSAGVPISDVIYFGSESPSNLGNNFLNNSRLNNPLDWNKTPTTQATSLSSNISSIGGTLLLIAGGGVLLYYFVKKAK